MRDIYETAKKAQMAPVRGRVKAMMAQPRAVAQARKVARQTTGFQKGGHVKKVSHDSELTKWFLERHGGTKKKKPHSTQEGRIAAGKRALWRGVEQKEKKDKKRRMGPRAPAQPKEAGMYVKKGGVVQKAFLGKLMSKLGIGKGRTGSKQEALAGQDYKRMRPEPTPEQAVGVVKKHMGYKKGGVMEYQQGGLSKTREAGKRYWETKMSKLLNKGTTKASYEDIKALHEKLKKETPRGKGKEKGKEHRKKLLDLMRKASGYAEGFVTGKKKGGKVDKKWIQKAVNPKHKGYCTPMTKKTCTPRRKALAKLFKRKAKKGWANGGTVVMPTVGNDVRTRAYKQGALIHPRPRPTTLAHGRMRGVGIAKRGW